MRATGLRESWRGFFPMERLSYREARRARRQPSWAYVAKFGCRLLPGSCLARISAVRGRMFQELRHQWAHGGGGLRNGRDSWGQKPAFEFQGWMLGVELRDTKGLGPIFRSTSHHDFRPRREPQLSSSPKQQTPASTPPSLTSLLPHLLNPRG